MQLALGTVQFGLTYGIAGRGTVVPEQEVRAILERAAALGVRVLDTAAAYGDIESRLGRLAEGLAFRVISKIPQLPADRSPRDAAAEAVALAQRSRDRLGDTLSGLMLHNCDDLAGARGDAVWRELSRWSEAEGVPIGASCYAPAQCAELARTRGIALAQLPGNALDQRLSHERIAAAGRPQVHLRSAFLQGMLLMPAGAAAQRLPAAAAALERWHRWCHERALSPLQAALGIVKGFAGVDFCVVGVDALEQLEQIAQAWSAATPLRAPELACNDETVIDPRLWKVPA